MTHAIPRTVAYLRVSTREQDLEKNKADILLLANRREFGHVGFVEERSRVVSRGGNVRLPRSWMIFRQGPAGRQ